MQKQVRCMQRLRHKPLAIQSKRYIAISIVRRSRAHTSSATCQLCGGAALTHLYKKNCNACKGCGTSRYSYKKQTRQSYTKTSNCTQRLRRKPQAIQSKRNRAIYNNITVHAEAATQAASYTEQAQQSHAKTFTQHAELLTTKQHCH